MKRTWRRGALPVALMTAILIGGVSGEDAKSDKLPADLAHVPTKAVGLISVRVADLWTTAAAKRVREKMVKGKVDSWAEGIEVDPEKIERVTVVLREVDGPESSPLIFFGTTEKFNAKEVFARLVPDGKETKVAGKAVRASEKRAVAALGDQAFVLGRLADVRRVLADTPDRKSGLAAAVRLAAGKHAAVVGVAPGALPPIPEKATPELEPFLPLLKASGATATLDLGKSGSLHLRATFPGANEAASGLKALEAARKLGQGFLDQAVKELSRGKENETLAGLVKELRDSVKAGSLNRDAGLVLGEVQVKIDPEVVAGALMGAVIRAREAAVRVQGLNNLKQIGTAFHNYASAYNGKFPAQAIYNKQGKPLLSWRVTILPYIEQQKLYEEFKLDEPWDSAHNKKLLAKMPKTYEMPGGKAPAGHTYFQGFSGKGAFFDGKRSADLNTSFTFKGTSNTLMIVEAGAAVPWTKPEDLPFDPAKKLPKLGAVTKGGVWTVLCDGSIKVLRDVSEKTVKWAITLDNRQPPPTDW